MTDKTPSGPKPVFEDASGRRALRLRLGAALTAAAAMALLSVFVFSVVTPPRLIGISAASVREPPPRIAASNSKLAAARAALLSRVRSDRSARRQVQVVRDATVIRGAYFAPWRQYGLDSFRAHAGELTHVYPAWLTLKADGSSVDSASWAPSDRRGTTTDLTRTARANGVRIVPVVSNAQDSAFDLARVKSMLADPAKSAAVADQLVGFVQANGYAGLQVDFELLDTPTAERLGPWLRGLAARLHAGARELSVTLETDLEDRSVKALAPPCDYAVVMAYDEHEPTSPPGAVASLGYTERTLKRFAALVGADRLVTGIGSYGYDWNVPEKTADVVTNQEAVARAARYRGGDRPQDVIDFDDAALEPTFQYEDPAGRLHEVWFLDAVTAANALTLSRDIGGRGAALWALGMEDPSVWNAFGLHAPPVPDLGRVVVPQQVDFVGDGELLRVLRRPTAGARTLERDPSTGLFTDESFTAYPSGWLVERSGAPEKTVALTFDDGPDPVWTPRILDVLKREGVKATFFMIGQQLADQPDLVRRVYAEGHEIGSHSFTHPNMAHVSEDRVRLELAATQRAFEAVLGRSVVLFRPPYNADSEPRTYGEIMPVAVAAEQNYITAGETIDPNDWELWRPGPNGTRVRLTPGEIESEVLKRLDYGQSVLLHDGGGDRSATVAALGPLIEALKARGYRFSTIGGLENRGRDLTMPPVPAADLWLARADAVAFEARRVGGLVLFWGFAGAIALGLVRIALMIGLAAKKRPEYPRPATAPRVDALVAAYNEATVIARTLSSLLASRDVDVRVIVVDDGSTDGTGAVVEREFGADPRVRLVRKANGGKASALNVALSLSEAEIVVGVDADTQLAPDALSVLLRPFADPKVGAVAGNVKVGNRTRLVTRWQSLEYITSQNVDRRAMSRLNAITVVPGAIGGYRAAALRAVGGYRSDTLAEDMDLTWRLRRAGWAAVNAGAAHAYTEAPDTLRALMKQRFRWTFGTLQCLWKHRAAVGRYGWFGGLALPTLWLFQIAAQLLAPFVDLQLLAAGVGRLGALWNARTHEDMPLSDDSTLWLVLAIYVAFMGLEIMAGWVAYTFDDEDKRELWLLPTQRLVYRQIMYLVVWRSLLRALAGAAHGWGKLARTGTVQVRSA